MLIGGLLEKVIGVRHNILLGGLFLVSGTIGASFCTSVTPLVFFYGFIFGAGIGISYSTPIVTCSRWFPKKKGLVTGLIVAGFGSGAFVFGELALSISNPDGLNVDPDTLYFDPNSSVIQNVPRMFQVLGSIYAVMIVIASFLVVEPTELIFAEKLSVEITSFAADSEDTGGGSGNQGFDFDVSQVMSNSLGYHLSFCFICTAVGGMFIAGNNKVYGEEYFSSEVYLSTVISVSSVFNGTGRIAWGCLADNIGPIAALQILSCLFSLVLLSYSTVAESQSEFMFAVWTFAILFFEGGNFALYLPTTIKLFGDRNASSNYGAIFLSYSLCNFVNIIYLADIGISFVDASIFLGSLCFVGFLSLSWLSSRVTSIFSFERILEDPYS